MHAWVPGGTVSIPIPQFNRTGPSRRRATIVMVFRRFDRSLTTVAVPRHLGTLVVCRSSSAHGSGERARRYDDHEPIDDEDYRSDASDPVPAWQALLGEHDERDHGHSRDVHHPQRHQDHEQQPATAETDHAVMKTHPDRAARAVTPR